MMALLFRGPTFEEIGGSSRCQKTSICGGYAPKVYSKAVHPGSGRGDSGVKRTPDPLAPETTTSSRARGGRSEERGKEESAASAVRQGGGVKSGVRTQLRRMTARRVRVVDVGRCAYLQAERGMNKVCVYCFVRQSAIEKTEEPRERCRVSGWRDSLVNEENEKALVFSVGFVWGIRLRDAHGGEWLNARQQ